MDYQLGIEHWGIPQSVRKMVNRKSTVQRMERILTANNWFAIHGDIQSGKTHLAIEIARKWRGRVLWINLSGLTAAQASQQLDAGLKSVNGDSIPASVPEFFETACHALGKGSLIVLDGLPKSQSLDLFERRLISLEQACFGNDVKLLSTSSGKIPSGVVDRLNGELAEEQAPRFSGEDRRELFRLSGAPKPVFDKQFQDTVGLLTQDHPVLLTSVVRYLERKKWRVEEEVWHGLLEKAYIRDVIADADQLLRTTVPDGESRNLLYRLNLSASPFTEKDVTEAAEVESTVSLPLERFRDALGAWIETAGDAAFRSSPLLASLGHLNLTTGTTRGVHIIFGRRFFRKKRITSGDALESFSHFHSAGEFSTAATVLIASLYSFVKIKDRGAKDSGLSELWVEGKLPDAIEMTTRLYLRSLQISVRLQLGKDYLSLVGDLDALLNQASEKDAWGVFGSCLIVILAAGLTNAPLALKYVRKALPTAKFLRTPEGKPYEFPENLRIAPILWACGAGCDTDETLKDWFEIIGELSPAERIDFFKGQMGEEGCSTICDGIWLREANKEPAGRDWENVLTRLRAIEAQGKEWKTQELSTAAVRAQIVTHTDYLKNMKVVVQLAETALSRPDASDLTKFLLGQVIGRAYFDAGEYVKSLEWLAPVTSLPVLSFPRLRMRALLEAGAAASHIDRNQTLEFANRALEMTIKGGRLPELEIVIALAEKTVALWYCNDRLSSFSSWEEALTRILECTKRDQKWKRLFVLLGYASGFFCSMASTDKPPGPDYVPPTSGFFLNEREQLEDLYDPAKEWFIPAQLAMFAEGVGRIDAASEWASRAVDLGRRLGGGDLSEGLTLYAVPQAVVDNRFGDALELALDGADSLMRAFVKGTSESKRQPTQEEWSRAETKASGIGLVPSAFRLATLWLADREKSKSAVLTVIDKCRELEKRARTPGIWSSAAQAFEECFIDNCNWRSLYQKSNELDGKGYPATRVIYFLGASLHANPSDSLRLQLAVFPFLEESYGHYGIYRRSVVPFVSDFWLRNVVSEAFQYSQPLIVKRRLENFTQQSGDHMEKSILSEVAAGLRVCVGADGRAWMDRRNGDDRT